MLAIGFGETLDGGDGLGASDGGGELDVWVFPRHHFRTRLAANAAGEVVGFKGVLFLPIRSTPQQPLPPFGDIFQARGVLLSEAQGESVIGVLG